MTAATLIHSARIPSGSDAEWVLLAEGAVAARGRGEPPPASPGIRVVNAGGRLLVPGFIDIHCHGGAGRSFDDGEAAIAEAVALHRRHGTTRTMVSLVSATIDDLEERLRAASRACDADPLLLGIHLEGPFLDAGHRGAHDAALLTRPSPEAVDRLVAAAGSHLSAVTLAPDLPGAAEALERFRRHGVRVALGHTGVDHDGAVAAFAAGASILTHAFNGMPGLHHREPGPVGAALGDPAVTIEVIADRVHVHDIVVRMLFATAPGRVALITDAMAGAGLNDGVFRLGSTEVDVRDGVARIPATGSLAGSTLTLDLAVRNAVAAGVALPDAVDAATVVPARALGLEDRLGRLEPGFAADAVLLDEDLQVHSVWAAGEPVPGTPGPDLPPEPEEGEDG
jgi:N-acetylglucosamine-6-phosphate deacetylase